MGELLIAALFAGAVAILATVAIEKLGGQAGGLIATLPSTIVPASLGIWATDPAALAPAMDAVAPGMLLNAGFLWLWRVIPPRIQDDSLRRRLAKVTAITLFGWLIGAIIIVLLGSQVRPTVILGAGGTIALLIVGISSCLTLRAAPLGRKTVPIPTLLARGVFAGLAIAAAIAVARAGHPIAAGVASVFPAIFLTTMISVWISQGEAVQGGAIGPMMLGSASVAGYAMGARVLMPWLGAWGALVAWILAIAVITIPAWLWLGARRRRMAMAQVEA
ncbi:MAG: hypothetical protein ACI9U2_002196 [Bradymonadia bacterium]|jgi:hypothetical protein